MNELELTEVEQKELPQLAALADAIWHEWFPSVIPMAQIDYMVEKFQSLDAIKEQLSEGYKYFFLTADGKTVGYTGVHPESDGRLFLSKLYIEKQYRGKHYATAAVELLREYCRENGLNAIHLTVNKGNTHAIDVYEKLGFKRSGDGVTPIGGGFVMDDYFYNLDI